MMTLLWRIANLLTFGVLSRMERKERQIKAERGLIDTLPVRKDWSETLEPPAWKERHRG